MAFCPCAFDDIWEVSLCRAKAFLLVLDDLNMERFEVH